jgi:hypothetical protein
MANKVAIALYALLGLGAVAAGVWFGFRPVEGAGHLHLEIGSGLMTIGALSLLVAWRFPQSWPWRAVIILFFALIAVVHWYDFVNEGVPLLSPLLNSVPILAIAAVEFAVSNARRSPIPTGPVSG